MKNLLFAFLCIAFSSCTTLVTVQKTLPPEIALPDHGEFLFVDRFIPNELDFNNQNKIEVFEKGHNKFIEGLKEGFDSDENYNLHLSDTTLRSHSAHEPAYNLKPDVVQMLCGDGNDYLLTLDNYNLYFDQDVDVVENEDGSKERTAYYDLVLNTYITLYDHDGGIIEKVKDENRIAHDQRSVLSGLLAVGPSMGKADKNAELISYDLGSSFILKFYPRKIEEMRSFFNTKPFEKAYRYYSYGNWQKAEEELMQYANDPDSKIAGRASYNLSVLYENLGKSEEMSYWYQNAVDKLGSKVPSQPMVMGR